MKRYYVVMLLSVLMNVSIAQPTTLHEDFATCVSAIPTGWQKYSVSGSDSWQCSSSGQSGNGTSMSGYSGGSNHTNEDWLISPLTDFHLYNNPMLSFWCRTKYSGPLIQVLVSSNYSGGGDPNLATWNSLPAVLPTVNSDVWFLSDNINLSSFKNQPFYIAFKYTSTSSVAAIWRIDEVNVADGNLAVSKKFMNVGQTNAGNFTSSSSFNFTMSGAITNFTIDIPAPFELSKDNSLFSNQLNYSSAISGMAQTVYVRVHPTVADKVYRNQLTFSLNGNLLAEKLFLLGTSLPDHQTLRVYNWNMRWFGDPSSCGCDTNQARLNAIQIMKDIDADMYCLQEIVNPAQIANIAAALGPKYQYVVSPFCSFATNTSSSSYGSGQKLAYIFNTDKIENAGTFGLLASTYPSDTASNSAYYCFSSGRFPYIFKAKIKLAGGASDTVIFSNIHAKALGDITSYNRRQCAATKMTDSLNALNPGKKIIVLGDYNDFLEGTDVSGLTVTPYKYMLDHGFNGITLPSHYLNQTTFVGSANTIFDNVACTSNLMSVYPDSSCFIFNEVESYIPDYVASTSDHLPVVSYFKFNFPTETRDIQLTNSNANFNFLNPSSNTLSLFANENYPQQTELNVYDITGHRLFHREQISLMHNSSFHIASLHSGFYFVELKSGNKSAIKKWMVN